MLMRVLTLAGGRRRGQARPTQRRAGTRLGEGSPRGPRNFVGTDLVRATAACLQCSTPAPTPSTREPPHASSRHVPSLPAGARRRSPGRARRGPGQRGTDGALLLRVRRGQQQQQGARDLQRHRRGRSNLGTAATLQRPEFSNGGGHRRAHDQPHRHRGRRRRVRPRPTPRPRSGSCGRPDLNGAGLFNGDDAVVLRKGTTVLDVIGQIGTDPGTEWGSGRRAPPTTPCVARPSVEAGDPDGAERLRPGALEWDGFAVDTFDDIGLATRRRAAPRR